MRDRTVEEGLRHGWDIPLGGRSPEDAKLPRHQISRAFIPPCIHREGGLVPPPVGLPLSDQPPAYASRNPRRTLLFSSVASYMPKPADCRDVHNCLRNQDLGVCVAGRPRTVFEQTRCPLPENGIRPGRASVTAPGRFAHRTLRGCGPESDLSGVGTRACASFPDRGSRRAERRKCIPPSQVGAP